MSDWIDALVTAFFMIATVLLCTLLFTLFVEL